MARTTVNHGVSSSWKKSIFYHWIEYYYPFTFSGSLLLFFVVLLSGFAYASNNLYALVLAMLGLCVLSFLLFLGRFQALRFGIVDIVWRPAGNLVSRFAHSGFEVSIGDNFVFYFFRLHFNVIGKLVVGRDTAMYVQTDGVATRAGLIDIPFYTPLCGLADLQGRLIICDVFGLTRTRIAPIVERQFTVSPPVFPNRENIVFKNSASMDSKRRMLNAEEEKYYMREYIPGDRLKDINWKASIRVNELITKIAPRSPEESRLIHVELRHFTAQKKDTATAIVHLNYLKSWLLSFLWKIQKEHPQNSFQVFTSDDIFLLENEDDLNDFSKKLGKIQFVQSHSFEHAISPSMEKFIFTTMFDPGLALSLSGHRNITCHVFRTRSGNGKNSRKIRLLPFEQGSLPLPGWWIVRKQDMKINSPSLQVGRFIDERLKVSLF